MSVTFVTLYTSIYILPYLRHCLPCVVFTGVRHFRRKHFRRRNIGRTEHCSNGTLVERNIGRDKIGRVEHWSNGTLVERNIRLTEHFPNV